MSEYFKLTEARIELEVVVFLIFKSRIIVKYPKYRNKTGSDSCKLACTVWRNLSISEWVLARKVLRIVAESTHNNVCVRL